MSDDTDQYTDDTYQVRCLIDGCDWSAKDAQTDLKTAQGLAEKHSEKEEHIAFPHSADTGTEDENHV